MPPRRDDSCTVFLMIESETFSTCSKALRWLLLVYSCSKYCLPVYRQLNKERGRRCTVLSDFTRVHTRPNDRSLQSSIKMMQVPWL